ncbi:gastrula zinc finger protein XlCGF26.1-like [Ylistrum balloti]|uniref:gastrula zinc finger protein XlCGF26.1-like n=1 Tax=Ylistrum balloti TaxID=509963 RepID=UPI00290585D9|nr:gastrula zinc finger protein XlCGF26.1-like [Ylistrum balloti]
MDTGSILLCSQPFRPIPMYGHRFAADVTGTGNPPPAAHFLPYFRPAPFEGLYSAPGSITAYNIAIQEHLRRLQCRHLGKVMDTHHTINNNAICTSNTVVNIPKPDLDTTQINHSVPPLPSKLDIKEKTRTTLNPYENFPSYSLGRKLFPCPNCRYTTDRRNNLKRHMLTMHQTTSKLLECCGILFRTKASLREHAMIFHYHGYTCYYCGRRFCRKALLKRHLSVHNGQKDFVCNVCDYATSHKSNLERHKKVHQRPEDCKDTDGSRSDLEHDGSKSDIDLEGSDHAESMEDLSVCSDSEDEEINVHSD